MDRDMDAIRKILFAVKDSDTAVSSVVDVSDEVFKFNTVLLIEAGLVIGETMTSGRSKSQAPAAAIITRLTWQGTDFLASIKEDAVWEKAKKTILKPAGAWTFKILTDYIKHELKTNFHLIGGP